MPNTHPHQFHFEILATLGLPGYLFICLFLLYFLSKSLRFYIKERNIMNLTSFLFILVLCVRARSEAELMIYVDSQQTLVLAGVGMDGAAPSAPTFARFAKGVSAAIMV